MTTRVPMEGRCMPCQSRPPGTPSGLPRARAGGSGRTRLCSDGSEGAAQIFSDGAVRQGQGRPDLGPPNLCRKNPGGAAGRLFRMAPLRLVDRSVTNHLIPPPGPPAVPDHHTLSPATGRALLFIADAFSRTEKGPRDARPILVRGFNLGVPWRLAGTSPAPGPRRGSRA